MEKNNLKSSISIITLVCCNLAQANLPEMDCIVEPSNIVNASTSVQGLITQVKFDRSDVIKKNQIIATLESKVEKAKFKRAKLKAENNANIELRRLAHNVSQLRQERNEKLVSINAISEQEMEELTAETNIAVLQVKNEMHKLAIAKAEFEKAHADLERTIIRSPIEGVVVQRFKTGGELTDGEPILSIAQIHPLSVETLMPIKYFGELEPGQIGNISLNISDQEYPAVIERIDRVADAASGTFGVRLRLENPNYEIPAGVRCKVAFTTIDDQEDKANVLAQSNLYKKANKSLADTERNWVLNPIRNTIEKIRKSLAAAAKDSQSRINSTNTEDANPVVINQHLDHEKVTDKAELNP